MYRTTADDPRLSGDQVTVRHAGAADQRALSLLAALDDAPRLHGPALVAEAGGRVVAAVPFRGGRPIADPFARTADAVALLELRMAQLRSTERSPERSMAHRIRTLLPRAA